MQRQIKKYFFALALFITVPSAVYAAPFFSDGFESGNLTHAENGASWISSAAVQVRTTDARTGTHSALFYGDLSRGFSELDFDLGAQKTGDIYIRYYVKWPSNYILDTSDGIDNNKAIRIWGDTYNGNPMKLGASFWKNSGDNLSHMQPETYISWGDTDSVLNCSGGMGIYTPLGGWTMTAGDLNRWVAIEWHFRQDLGTGNRGALGLWIDGVQIFDSQLAFPGAPCGSEGYLRRGYLFGDMNDNFLEDVYVYVDDVVFSDTYIGPDGSSDVTAPSMPTGLIVV